MDFMSIGEVIRSAAAAVWATPILGALGIVWLSGNADL